MPTKLAVRFEACTRETAGLLIAQAEIFFLALGGASYGHESQLNESAGCLQGAAG